LGSHFVAPRESAASPPTSSNPFRRNSAAKDGGVKTHSRQTSRDFAGHSGSPSNKFPNYRETELGGLNEAGPSRRSHDGLPPYEADSGRLRRGSSLNKRFPGDESNRPLDILRRDSRKAARSPHLSKRQLPGADIIDKLDPTINKVPYHHEGPYDAASLARNTDYKSSPIAALEESNREALKSTAPEKIKDSLDKHAPLDGFAVVPPGEPDQMGRRYNYEEGENQMFEGRPEGGEYKRYPGVVSFYCLFVHINLALTRCSRTMTRTTSTVKASLHTLWTGLCRGTPSTNVTLTDSVVSSFLTVR